MLVLILLPLVSASISTLIQVICEPSPQPLWPPSSAPLSSSSLSHLSTLSQHTKTAYSPLLDQDHIQSHGRFVACSSPLCSEAMKTYLDGVFGPNTIEFEVNSTMFDPNEACPRVNYLLERDNVAAAGHIEIMAQLQPFSTEIEQFLALNTSNIHDLLPFAQYSAFGGRFPGLSEEAHQWFSSFYDHFTGNLMVGSFDQGKMLTFELLSDILTQMEAWTPFSVYIAPKSTYTALLKILTLYSGHVNPGDSFTFAIARSPDSDISLSFTVNTVPIDSEYCGNPCLVATFIDKMRGKRMFGSWGGFRKACEYLGDEDLSWKKYYMLVGAMVGIGAMFKGSDWMVKKTAPKPKNE